MQKHRVNQLTDIHRKITKYSDQAQAEQHEHTDSSTTHNINHLRLHNYSIRKPGK